MMKEILQRMGLLFLFSLCSFAQLWAGYVEVDGVGYKTNSDGTATIKYPVVTVLPNSVIFPDYGHLVIPETIVENGRSYRVTKMDETVFQECPTITAVTFNEGLESIGDEAFLNCVNLKEVHFSSTLADIGMGVFEGTPWLADQPDGVIYAGKVALLYKGRVPDGTDLVLEDGTQFVATSAFYGQKGIVRMTLPEGLQTIGSGAFCACKGLETISLPSTLTDFGNDCFRDCQALTTVRIPDAVTEIGSYAFINCEALAELVLPKNLKNIQFEAFVNCKSLPAIELPAGLEKIGRRAFDKCPALTQIASLNPVPPVCASENVFTEQQYAEAELTVPAGSLAAYQEAKGWKNFKNIKETVASAVGTVHVSAPAFRLQGRTLQLAPSAAAQGVAVYDICGRLLYTGYDEAVTLPAAKVFLVRIGQTVRKVLVP